MEKLKVNRLYDGAVAQVILDDGKGNVLDSIMMGELQQLLDSFHTVPELKLITFEGAGKHFSFGASVEEHRKENAAEMLRAFHQLFFTLKELAIPTLASISGQCLGGGMELAIMCNFLFADQSAKLGQPEIVLGVFPPPASVILAEKIGTARAEDLILTGRSISAEEAKKMGLVNDVYGTKEELQSGVGAFIEQYMLPKSASSLRYAVRAARTSFNLAIDQYLAGLGEMYVSSLMETHDANEGISSFLEKRKPNWQNR